MDLGGGNLRLLIYSDFWFTLVMSLTIDYWRSFDLTKQRRFWVQAYRLIDWLLNIFESGKLFLMPKGYFCRILLKLKFVTVVVAKVVIVVVKRCCIRCTVIVGCCGAWRVSSSTVVVLECCWAWRVSNFVVVGCFWSWMASNVVVVGCCWAWRVSTVVVVGCCWAWRVSTVVVEGCCWAWRVSNDVVVGCV